MLISLVQTTQRVHILSSKITRIHHRSHDHLLPTIVICLCCSYISLQVCSTLFILLYFIFFLLSLSVSCPLIRVLSLPITQAVQCSFVSTAVSTPFSQCLFLSASFFPFPPLSPLPLLSPWSSPLVQPSREAEEGKEC